jgi:hypothetical protein
MRRLLYLLSILAVGCNSTPESTPEVQSVYDAEGNPHPSLTSKRPWEEQQEIEKDLKNSIQKQPRVDASGPINEPPKKK